MVSRYRFKFKPIKTSIYIIIEIIEIMHRKRIRALVLELFFKLSRKEIEMTVLSIFLLVSLLIGFPVLYAELRLVAKQISAIFRRQVFYERAGEFWLVLYMRIAFALIWFAGAWALAERLGIMVIYLVK